MKFSLTQTDLEVSIWNPDVPDIDRYQDGFMFTLLICHYFFYLLVFITVYHFTTLKI